MNPQIFCLQLNCFDFTATKSKANFNSFFYCFVLEMYIYKIIQN